MTSEVVIAALADKAAPKDYTVASSQQIIPLCITASLDGTAAAAAYVATVEFISDAGLVMARCPCSTQLAAGASADVSWFPLRAAQSTTSASSTYQTVVLQTPDVRSYWPLDETSGTTWADLGPSAKALTAVGSPSFGQPPLITTGHSAVFPNGGAMGGFASDYGQNTTDYGIWPGDGSLTCEAWIKTTATIGSVGMILGVDDGSHRLCQFRVGTTGKLELVTFDAPDTTPTTATGTTVLNTGATFYVAATYNGTTHVLTVYVNGSVEGTATAASSYTGDVKGPSIATRVALTAQNKYSGTIDEVALYSRALTAAEISSHYSAGTA